MQVKPRDGYSFDVKLTAKIWTMKHGKNFKPAGYEFPKELDKKNYNAKGRNNGH